MEQNGYTSDPPQTRTHSKVAGRPAAAAAPAPAAAATGSDQENVGLFDYYVPRSRYSTQGMRQQLTSRGYFQTPSGARIFSPQHPGAAGTSQQQTSYETQFVQSRRAGNVYQTTAAGTEPVVNQPQPFYNIRRSAPRGYPLPRQSVRVDSPSRQSVRMHSPTYVYDDVEVVSHSPDFYPHPVLPPYQQQGQSAQEAYAVEDAVCPLCGSASYHVHEGYDEAGAVAEHSQFVYRR